LADPGGICVPARVQEDATGKVDLAFEDTGEQVLKISRGPCGCTVFVETGWSARQ